MNGIPDRDGNKAFGHGRDSVKMLAAQLGAMAWLNEQATKSTFVEHAPNSRLIHVHSHVYWDAADPRAHHINFADSDTVSESGKLTTREVFALPLSKGCHRQLGGMFRRACQSGLRRRSYGAHSSSATLWSLFDSFYSLEYPRPNWRELYWSLLSIISQGKQNCARWWLYQHCKDFSERCKMNWIRMRRIPCFIGRALYCTVSGFSLCLLWDAKPLA